MSFLIDDVTDAGLGGSCCNSDWLATPADAGAAASSYADASSSVIVLCSLLQDENCASVVIGIGRSVSILFAGTSVLSARCRVVPVFIAAASIGTIEQSVVLLLL